jgi:16S rRNA (guanine527-N7)-methyltransferase
MRQEFLASLAANEPTFGMQLSQDTRERLADHYELLLEHNPILHLVGPCTPEEFATRHVLESLTMLEYLPADSRFADVGSGGGLPAIPCLIARDDLRGVLIESKEKKADFLRLAAERCGIQDRTEMIPKQFAETTKPDAAFVTCRALDKFVDKLPRLAKWAGRRRMLLFGAENLREELSKAGRTIKAERLMPLSERRYLFIVD